MLESFLTLHRRWSRDRAERLRYAEERASAYEALELETEVRLGREVLAGDVDDKGEDVLVHLACLVPGSLRRLQGELVRRDIVHPGELFWHGSAEARDRILRELRAGQSQPVLRLDHLLRALAWIGDEEAQRAFHDWRRRAPAWAPTLRVPVHEYTLSAGWELTPEGKRRELWSALAFRLSTQQEPLARRVIVAAPAEERSPWLDRSQTLLFDLDADLAPLAWLGLRWPRLVIPTCNQSTAFTFVFSDLDARGRGHWSERNVKPASFGRGGTWPALSSTTLWTSSQASPPLASHWRVREHHSSQVGGHPRWLQGAAYPRCPGCERAMPFVAQLDAGDLDEFGEGLYFAFLCNECGVAATGYQQT